METTYRDWEKRRREREGGRRTASRRRSGGAGAELGPRERRRLVQLGVCLVLFLTVFIGKGVFPDQVERVREQVVRVMQSDTDFRTAFASLGRSISEGEPVLDTLGELWVDVFGATQVSASGPARPGGGAAVWSQVEFLSGYPQRTEPAGHWLALTEWEREDPEPAERTEPEPSTQPTPEPEAEPAVVHVDYTGPALPDNATMDRYNLQAAGVTETVTPALGWVSSAFGWREHPVDGEEKFHNGVDLGVNTGTDVLAFADGTVDYIGDSPIYGLYLQLRHAGGLTTFYAHCDKLLVQQGQAVAAGERIAQSGATGNATGPHLHFELKLNGVLLNPTYYIETT